MGLPASYTLVTLAFLGVLYFDPQFRHDLMAGLKSYAGDSNKYKRSFPAPALLAFLLCREDAHEL